jgi:hypothetical protein
VTLYRYASGDLNVKTEAGGIVPRRGGVASNDSGKFLVRFATWMVSRRKVSRGAVAMTMQRIFRQIWMGAADQCSKGSTARRHAPRELGYYPGMVNGVASG